MSETVIREEILNQMATDYPRMVIMADSLKLENNRNEVMKALTEIVMLRDRNKKLEEECSRLTDEIRDRDNELFRSQEI